MMLELIKHDFAMRWGGGVIGDERGIIRVFPPCCKASKVASCLSRDGQPKLPNIGTILSSKQVYITNHYSLFKNTKELAKKKSSRSKMIIALWQNAWGQQMGWPLVRMDRYDTKRYCASTTTNYHNISLVSSSPQFLNITSTSGCIQQSRALEKLSFLFRFQWSIHSESPHLSALKRMLPITPRRRAMRSKSLRRNMIPNYLGFRLPISLNVSNSHSHDPER